MTVQEKPAPEETTGAMVDNWFNKWIQNSPASRDEKVYNHLLVAKEKLKQALKEGVADGTV